MLLPPVVTGALKLTLAWALPAVAVPITGAAGTTALTKNDWLMVVAALVAALPAWLALMVQVPAVMKLRVPPLVMVHTAGVAELKLTGKPEEAVAVSVGVVPKFCAPGLPKVMVCGAAGVTALEAAEAGPVPATLLAVTVKV